MSNDTNPKQLALVPIEQRQVDFYGDEIPAALVVLDDGETQIYVPIRPICKYLGLSWVGQRERISRDQILSKALKGVRMTRTPLEAGKRGGGTQEVLCLPIELLPGWLFGIDASRVKSEMQPKIILYQGECFKVLWREVQANALPLVDVRPAQHDETILALENIRQNALAVVRLTEEQIALANRVTAHDLRLDRAAEAFRGLRQRIEVVERRTAPPVFIRDDQASQLKSQVKALAEHLTRLDSSKNHYGRIFETIYLQFGVTSYARIRQGQFETVMQFLTDWRTAADAGNLSAPRQLTLFDQPAEPEQGA